jgi:hypothetical protein
MPEAAKRVYRYEVPIDDQTHTLPISSPLWDHQGPPLAVAAIRDGERWTVEFWAEHRDGARVYPRSFRVYGTGHPVPGRSRWCGTTPRLDGLVFHLYEVVGEDANG